MNRHHYNVTTIQALLVAASIGFAADPMPYDSIGNPLNKLPSTNKTIQRQGDSLNIVPNRVRVNQAGYRQSDVMAGYAKFYCVGCGSGTFKVEAVGGAVAGTGSLVSKGATVSGQVTAYASNSAEHAHNGEGDWKVGYPMTGKAVSGALTQGVLPAALPAGRYVIRVGSDSSVPFVVSDNVYGMARDAALKFFGVARSGDYESWFHPASHMWDGWLYDSAKKNTDGTYMYKGALKGGWYDCGNHLKEARTNSYPLAALGMLAATMPEKDADRFALNQNYTTTTDRIPDVLREAWVGAQFVLNSWRLANGIAKDMVLSVGDVGPDFNWWGRPENHDAVLSPTRGGRKERVLLKNWGSASMGDFAAGMAFLSRMYRPYSASFADSALTIARAMYETAKSANKQETAPDYTGDMTLFDDMGLAAVALLWATGESKYLQEAAYATGMPNGKGGICPSADYGPNYATSRFEGGFFGCGTNGMLKNGGPTDYGSVQSLALYAFAKLVLTNADTAARYGIRPGQRDTLLLRSINQMAGPLWGSGNGATVVIPTGDQYNPTRLTYDTTWYAMGIGYGKSGWWNKYQFGNLADLYMFYDMTSLVDGRTILDKPGNTDWKRKEVLQVLLGGLNYMFGTNALDLSYVYGVGRKNPMHPHHRAANPEGKNVPGAYYNYTIPVGGLYGGLMTGPSNTEALVEKFGGPVGQTEANCPDAQVAVLIPLMGLSKETPDVAPKTTVKVLYTTDTSAMIEIDLDKWGTVKLGYGLDSLVATQTTVVSSPDTGGTFKILIRGLVPATQYYFHVVASDLKGQTSTSSRWPKGASDSIPFSFTTKAQPLDPPQFANIRVCNVTSDSAEIMWYTPNGEYLSGAMWADTTNWKLSKFSYVDSDAVGDVPVRFHRVKLHGLKPKTTYWFRVGVPGSYGTEVGCFRTPGEDVKFDIRTTRYEWDGKPALGIAVVNQDVKSYDSLQIRLYVNGTKANILDLAARVDIAFAYRADGFADSGLFTHTKNVQKSRPKLIDPTCNPDAGSCAWYFDLPLHGAVMETQARWRLDVVFDRHNLIRDSTEILNMAPTHDPFAGTDWSFRPHVAGGDGGMSPLDYPGVPVASKNAIDSMAMDIPVNPYIAVYRRNEFVYGYSPYAAEQATKRTSYAIAGTFEAPFDVVDGSTIQLDASSGARRLRGTIDAYDVLLPAAKGWINAVWVNGVALSDAERKAALARQADGTWKVDLPLRFTTGTNKLDVTFFASSDSVDAPDPAGSCTDGKGCAFLNRGWYVNYVSDLTPSTLSVVDPSENPLRTVVADSSFLRVRVKDANANKSKTVADAVMVSVKDLGTGRTLVVVSLVETGPNTGVFETELRAAVSGPAVGAQFQTPPGDTLLFKYADAADPSDSSEARVWVFSNVTSSRLSVVDAAEKTVGLLVPDSSALRVRLVDSDANADRAAVDTVLVSALDLRTGASTLLRLPETGVSTGIFQTDLMAAVSAAAAAGQFLTIPGDTIRFRYADADDPTDTSAAIVWSVASWPTVSGGAVVASCGGSLSVEILLDRSLLGRGQAVPSSVDSVVVRLRSPDGDTLAPIVLGASGIAPVGAAYDRVVAPLPFSTPFRPDWTAVVSLRVPDGQGGMKTVSGILSDSVGPWIDSAKIVENLEGRAVDSVLLWTAEPIAVAGAAVPVRVFRAGAPVVVASFDAFRRVDSAAGKWLLLLPAGVVKAGDSLALAANVSDARGNAALDCPDARRRVDLQWRPSSVSAAWIVDSDGDAQADRIVLVYKRALRAEEVPTALSATFGLGDSIRTAPVSAKVGDSVVSVALAPFPRSETRGSSASGSGVVTLFQGAAALGSAPLSDSVGPALLTASLRYGPSADTLRLRFSESVSSTLAGDWMQKLSAAWGVLPPAGIPTAVDARTWAFPVDTFSVTPGDSVRPSPAGRFVDASARPSAPSHPGVVVEGSERPPVGGWMMDLDGDGAAETVELVWSRAPRTRPAFSIRWPSAAGGLDESVVAQGSWTCGADPLRCRLAVGPFDRGVTSADRDDLGSMASGSEAVLFPVHDAVAPTILSATLRYASSALERDTLRVRWSEPILWTGAEPLLMVRSGGPDSAVHASATVLLPDSTGATLLLDPDGVLTTTFQKGDSVRLAPASAGTVSDWLGNATEPGWHVPVLFGRRPPQFGVTFFPAKRIYGGWPLAGKRPFDIQVRPRGSSVWQDLSTSAAVDPTDVARQIGPTISTNQPLRGMALIYDNQGTFVASVDFTPLAAAFGTPALATDPSNQYEVRVAWNGLAQTGAPAGSGVYLLRLILRQNYAGDGEVAEWGFYNQTFQFGWEVPVK